MERTFDRLFSFSQLFKS